MTGSETHSFSTGRVLAQPRHEHSRYRLSSVGGINAGRRQLAAQAVSGVEDTVAEPVTEADPSHFRVVAVDCSVAGTCKLGGVGAQNALLDG